jgi:hypothetical protein
MLMYLLYSMFYDALPKFLSGTEHIDVLGLWSNRVTHR